MKISLSIHAITAQVLAQTALRSHLRDYYPPMLHPEHADQIPPMVRGAMGEVCLAMAPWLADCDLGEETESDLMQLDFDENCRCNLIALRLQIEHAIVARMLAAIYSGTDNEASALFERDFQESLQRLRRSLHPLYTPGALITPHAF